MKTMDEFEESLHRAYKEVWDLVLFEFLLGCMAVFMLSALVLFILGMSLYLTILPLALIVILKYPTGETRRHINTIEQGNPILEDRLRTAYDNRENKNFIIEELLSEVGDDLSDLNTERIFDLSLTKKYVASIIVSALVLLSLMLSGFEPDLANRLGGVIFPNSQGSEDARSGSDGGGGQGGSTDGASTESQSMGSGLGQSEDIYGQRSVAKLGDREIELELHPEYGDGGAFEIDEDPAEEGSRDNWEEYGAESSQTYTENIPNDLENLVRGYFEKVSEE